MSARHLLAAVALAAFATAAPAARANAQPYSLQFVAESDVSAFGVRVGPYTANLTDLSPAPGSTNAITIFCDDVLHYVSYNPFDVFVTRLVGGDLSKTRGGAGSRGLYKRVAWLTAQFAVNATSSWHNIHAAIWQTTLPGNATGAAEAVPFLDAVAAAEAGDYAGFDFGDYVIITDVTAAGTGFGGGAPGAQEFLSADSGVTTTPEPSTYALAATGLLAIAGVARRRRTA